MRNEKKSYLFLKERGSEMIIEGEKKDLTKERIKVLIVDWK